MRLDKERLLFGSALLALSAVFFLGAALTGRALVISRHLYVNNIFFGIDSQRHIEILTEPGLHNPADRERTNVHPLFSPLVKPWGQILQKIGISKGISGVIVNAAAGACALILAAWFFRRRGVARLDVWLLTLLMGASSTWISMSVIPGPYIFSLNVIILTFILAEWTLRRPDAALSTPARRGRGALWLTTGVLNYGLTVTNGMMSFLAYGFARNGRRGWVRAAWYGAAVLGVGIGLSYLAGSYLDLWVERQWVADNALRGGESPMVTLLTLVTPTLWSLAVPWPTFQHFTYQGDTTLIGGILHWNYSGAEWVLVAACAALLAVAAWAVARDRDPLGRRLSAGLGACLAFHMLMHRFYHHAFEGLFLYTGHSLFLLFGLFAPLAIHMKAWPPCAKWSLRAFLLLLALALAVRNFHYLWALRSLIPLANNF